MNCFVILCLTIDLSGKGVHAVNQIFDIDGTKNGSNGVITSPGYPGNYPNNVNYTWILRTGHPKATVNISIIELAIKKHIFSPCGDYLQIYETEPCCFQAMKRCGSYGSFGTSVNGEKITLSFVSDELHKARSFNLTWKVRLWDIITTKKSTLMTTKRTTSTTSTTGNTTISTRISIITPDITTTKVWKITSKTPPEKTVILTSTAEPTTTSRKTPTKTATIMTKALRTTTRTTTSTTTATLTTTLPTTELTKSLSTTPTTTLITTSRMWKSNLPSSSQLELLIYDLQETTASSLITTKTSPSIILTTTYTTNQTTSPITTQRTTSNRLRLTTRTTFKRDMIPLPTAKPKTPNITPITSVKTPARTTTTKTLTKRSETWGSKHSMPSMSSQHHSSIFDKSRTKSIKV